MEKEKEKLDRATHEIQVDGDLGQVQIADEVVAIIAGMAATEVKGVASMAGNIKNELVECAKMVADLDVRMLKLNEEILTITRERMR